MPDDTVVHLSPFRRDIADFIIGAYIKEEGFSREWEQLWARKISDDEFELCCIPFFTYGLALGDIVQVKPMHGRKYCVSDVMNPSGQRTLRFWLKNLPPNQRNEAFSQSTLRPSALVAMEYYSQNLLAVSADNETAERLVASLEELIKSDVISVEFGN